jgi:hypothetical protein
MSASYFISRTQPNELGDTSKLLIDPGEFNKAIRDHWSDAEIRQGDMYSLLGWVTHREDVRYSLEGRLFTSFLAFFSPVNDDIVEFTIWFRGLIPDSDPLCFYLEGYDGYIELVARISPQSLKQQMQLRGYF